MYVRTGLALRPLKCGGSGVDKYNRHHPKEMPTALEAGTLNGHGIAGLGAGVSYIQQTGMETIGRKNCHICGSSINGVKDIPNVKVYGDFETKKRCPIVTLNIGDYDSSEVSDELLMTYNISTRRSTLCTSYAQGAWDGGTGGCPIRVFLTITRKKE